MNKVILMGRLTRDPEVRTAGANGTTVARYSLAVNRAYKRDGEPDVDFINCVAFGNRAEFAGKYLKKGRQMLVEGELRTSNYTDKDGNKRTSVDVVVANHYFADSKPSGEKGDAPQTAPAAEPAPAQPADGFMDYGMDDDDELPF